jgi:hypothetical protein
MCGDMNGIYICGQIRKIIKVYFSVLYLYLMIGVHRMVEQDGLVSALYCFDGLMAHKSDL